MAVVESRYERQLATGAGSGTAPVGVPATARRPALPPAPYLVVGLGRAGTAVASALAGRVGSAAVRVWDCENGTRQAKPAASLRALGVEVRLGGDGLDLLGGVGTVVKSPGVPPWIPVLATAVRCGIEVVDEFDVGWRLVPAPTFAVTGTNGKSTVAALSVAVLAAHGLDPVLAGNTVYGPPLSALSAGRPPRSVVAEVSSYQAEGSPALVADAAVFTNLTPDHLDRYGTIEAYGDAKRKLFVRGERTVPLAVLNADDSLGREIGEEVEARGGRVLRYGKGADADYRIGSWSWREGETEAEVSAPRGSAELRLRLAGAHHLANATAVLALADELELPREVTLAALSRAAPLPGRCELLDVDCPYEVMADRCYTPDSVTKSLQLARSLVEPRGGRLLVVLGLIGGGGPTVGRKVGAEARRRSDHLILSGVSYRGEPRLVTLEQLVLGAREADGGPFETFVDRRRAVSRALELARPGDFVAILGRGAVEREATDARGGFRWLDDRQVVRELA